MNRTFKTCLTLGVGLLLIKSSNAQTDMDGIMMAKRNLCSELAYSHSKWDHYWEGTFYRDNLNIGNLTSTSVSAMSNYGISDRFNVMFSLPWISNKASAGTLHPMQGIQDLSLAAKYRFWSRDWKQYSFSVLGVAGVSTPLSNYVADFLPVSIGMHSKTASGRIILDAARNNFFITASGSYVARSNVKIDRFSYYTTEMHYTNMVAMPNYWNTNIRVGYRKDQMVLEAYYDRMNTLGGFDIRKNDMPFLSNNMDATRIGAHVRIPIPNMNGLGVVVNGQQTLSGRNVGKTFQYMAGVFYIAEFSGKGAKK